MRIAIVVHGRFNSFEFARSLLQRGHDVSIFTNYPTWSASRFGLPAGVIRSFVFQGLLSRVAWSLKSNLGIQHPEAGLNRLFGYWAASQIIKEKWDVVQCWSGVAEECLQALDGTQTLRQVMRASTHIQTQAYLLESETKRTGVNLERPGKWIIEREKREYDLADQILTISSFSHDSFLQQGVPANKVKKLLAGSDLDTFRPEPHIIQERCDRIMSGKPLHVLNVGTFSLRKGMWDFAEIIRSLDSDRFNFRFVGPVAPEARDLTKIMRNQSTFIAKQPQSSLPNVYKWGDVFVLPTIEDGFPAVLSQAAAAGLPILTTPNGAGVDLVGDGTTGFILPIRSSDRFVKQLLWCDANREHLAGMVYRIYQDFQPRRWQDVAVDFEVLCS